MSALDDPSLDLEAPRWAPYREVKASLAAAVAEACRKRNPLGGLTVSKATHDRLAECEQQWREMMAARYEHAPPAPARNPDGTAPTLLRVMGHPIRIDDAADGYQWDTGPEPLLPFPTLTGVIHPGPGMVFAPDAQITGRGVVEARANPDGTATVTWHADPQGQS